MTQTNRLNRFRYRLYAPVYGVAAPLERGRERAIVKRSNASTGAKTVTSSRA